MLSFEDLLGKLYNSISINNNFISIKYKDEKEKFNDFQIQLKRSYKLFNCFVNIVRVEQPHYHQPREAQFQQPLHLRPLPTTTRKTTLQYPKPIRQWQQPTIQDQHKMIKKMTMQLLLQPRYHRPLPYPHYHHRQLSPFLLQLRVQNQFHFTCTTFSEDPIPPPE